MKVKELYKKYKDYSIELFGRPLEQPTIPFTFLPDDKKERDNMEIAQIEIIEKEFKAPRYSFYDFKYKGTDYYKGVVKAYCVKTKES